MRFQGQCTHKVTVKLSETETVIFKITTPNSPTVTIVHSIPIPLTISFFIICQLLRGG